MKKIAYYQYNELPAKVKNILLKEYDIDEELFEHSFSQAVVLDITDSIDCLKQYKLYMQKKETFMSVTRIKTLQMKSL